MRLNAISVNPRYKSSTRIDGDTTPTGFIDSFIVHGTASHALTTIAKSVASSSQRAFTLTGPYGSGKSTLALFLASLLSTSPEVRDSAAQKIKSSPELLSSIDSGFGAKQGWRVYKHVCGLDSPVKALLSTLVLQTQGSEMPEDFSSSSDAECVAAIRHILNQPLPQEDGILILIDELGKALDFQSRTGGDLYFFQELADIAQQSSNKVVLLGFLHQSFAEYAKGKDILTQKEWAKVQGRYVDIGYNPTIDESLILVGDSLDKQMDVKTTLNKRFEKLVELTTVSFKGQLQSKSALLATLPIDPITSLLLGPISRRRFSQNERSLFGFLASNEKYGFREFLHKNYTGRSFSYVLYTPELFWDYLQHNLHHVIVTSTDSKAWLEACDAVHRAAQKGGDLHVAITKLIALTTVFGFQHHLHASLEFLTSYFAGRGEKLDTVEQAIEELERWSIIIHRQKHNALFIFQGSDIDINGLIAETIESIKRGVDWTPICNAAHPILAASHYHRTGALRWANAHIVEKLKKITSSLFENEQISGEAFATFVLVTNSTAAELQRFSGEHQTIAFGLPQGVEAVKSIAIQLIALEQIRKTERQIAHDLIAKNELDSRIDETQQDLEEHLSEAYKSARWFYAGEELEHKPLSALASDVADIIYHQSPVVLNELVNRAKPSGSANAAINKLMLAMLEHASVEDLGFPTDTFPPEKGIYLSCLKSKGWHRQTDEGFTFPARWDREEKTRHPDMFGVWQSGVDFIKRSNSLVTMDQLYDYWMRPPFGLTSGLCRIYGLALLKSLDGQVAYYDQDSTKAYVFIPELDEVFVNKLHKYPQETGVRYFAVDNIQTDLIHKIADAVQSNSTKDESILAIAKHIVGLIHKLEPWVKKTSGEGFVDGEKGGLSREARAFRNEVLRANDPYKLILESLPQIFSVDLASVDASNELSRKLKRVIEELTAQHPMLIEGFENIIKEQLAADFDESLKARALGVEKTSKRASVKQFASRIADYIGGKVKFEAIIMTAAGAPERNWTDSHIRAALDEINNLCIQFRRVESFSRVNGQSRASVIAVMTRNLKGEEFEYEGFLSDELDNQVLEEAKSEVSRLLSNLPKESRRALLSQLLISNMETVAND